MQTFDVSHRDGDAVLVDSLDNLVIADGTPIPNSGNDTVTTVFANTLDMAEFGTEQEPVLFLSLWLRSVTQIGKYRGLFYCAVPKLGGVSEMPIKVLADIATTEWLLNRYVAYDGSLVYDETSKRHRAIIKSIRVGPAPKGAQNDMPLDKFIRWYVADQAKRPADDSMKEEPTPK